MLSDCYTYSKKEAARRIFDFFEIKLRFNCSFLHLTVEMLLLSTSAAKQTNLKSRTHSWPLPRRRQQLCTIVCKTKRRPNHSWRLLNNILIKFAPSLINILPPLSWTKLHKHLMAWAALTWNPRHWHTTQGNSLVDQVDLAPFEWMAEVCWISLLTANSWQSPRSTCLRLFQFRTVLVCCNA